MERTITVRGVGQASRRPDTIEIGLTLEAQSRDYARAAEEANRRIEALQQALEEEGFDKKDLKTVDFRVRTQDDSYRGNDGKYHRVFGGYVCSYQMKLAFPFDAKRLARTLTALAHCGAEAGISVGFTVKDRESMETELLESAARDARRKAEALCRASGAKLGELLRIDYNWSEISIFSQTQYRMLDCAPVGASCAPEIEPEDVEAGETAAFVWTIE